MSAFGGRMRTRGASAALRLPRDGRLEHCEHPGCDATTRMRKPRCPDHVRDLEAWAETEAGWQAYQDELGQIERGELRPDGIAAGAVAEDVRGELRRGARTLGRIADDLTIPAAVVVAIAEVLHARGELELRGRGEPKRVVAELVAGDAPRVVCA